MTEFSAVDLEDTFILDWRYEPDAEELLFQVEASLWPGHPHFERPKPGEYTCYKHAVLLFRRASILGPLPAPSEVKPFRDPDGSEDYGDFHALTLEEGLYHVVTEFADLLVRCDSVRLEMKE